MGPRIDAATAAANAEQERVAEAQRATAAAAEAAAATAAAAALAASDPIATLSALFSASQQRQQQQQQQQQQQFNAFQQQLQQQSTALTEALREFGERQRPPPATFHASARTQFVYPSEADARRELGVPDGDFPVNLLVATFPSEAAASAWIRTERTKLGLSTPAPAAAPAHASQPHLQQHNYAYDEEGAEYPAYTVGSYIPLVPLPPGNGLVGVAAHDGIIHHSVATNGTRILSMCSDIVQDLLTHGDTVPAADMHNKMLILMDDIDHNMVSPTAARFDILTLGAKQSTAASREQIMSAASNYAFGAADGQALLNESMRGFSEHLANAHRQQAVRAIVNTRGAPAAAPLAAPRPPGGGGRGGAAGGAGAGGGARGGGAGGRGRGAGGATY